MKKERPHTNSRLLKSLNTYINEDNILGSIEALRSEVKRIETATGPSRRTANMQKEITSLEDKLAYCRIQANIRTVQYRNTKS